MPKEYVSASSKQICAIPVPVVRAVIGWSQSGSVQLATENESAGEVGDSSRGWFMELDRPAINRMINLLRKARDTAFGRDE